MYLINAGKAVSSLDSSTQAWVTAVVTAGGTVSAGRQTIIDTLIKSLKSTAWNFNGSLTLWDSLDWLWIYAGENSQQAQIDLRRLVRLTENGSPTWTANKGYLGVFNSTTVYLDLGVKLSAATRYAANTGMLATWNIENVSNEGCALGIADDSAGSNFNSLTLGLADTNLYAGINGGSASLTTPTTAGNNSGFLHGTRTAAGATQNFQNGASLGTGTNAAGTIPSSFNITGLARMNSATGTPSRGCGNTQALSLIGGGCNLTDHSNLYTIIHTALNAISNTNFP